MSGFGWIVNAILPSDWSIVGGINHPPELILHIKITLIANFFLAD